MKNVLLALLLLVIVVTYFYLTIRNRRENLYEKAHDNLELYPPPDDIELVSKEWGRLSWSGSNPIRVIGLALIMSETMKTEFEKRKHKTTSFYSQVKYLVKKGRIVDAFVFLMESRRHRTEALMYAHESDNPIDLEVLGAPDFMVARTPIVGWFGDFKFEAKRFLLAADNKIAKMKSYDPLMSAIIWSKLYALTRDEEYRERVRTAGLEDSMDKGQMLRIAKHLGFKSIDGLYVFCQIKTRDV